MTTIAKNIRYLRKKHNLSQEQLAKIVDRGSFTTIQKWESDVSEPSLGCVATMADFFGVNIDDLVKVDLEIAESQPIADKAFSRRMKKYIEGLSTKDLDTIKHISCLGEDARDSILHQIDYEYEKEQKRSKTGS